MEYKSKKGLLITFEGIDGSGKTTQVKLLHDFLSDKYDVVLTREPGGTQISEKLRKLLLDRHDNDCESIGGMTELFLFIAARAQHVEEVIKPALKEGKIVICDRYIDSTLVYQTMKCKYLTYDDILKYHEKFIIYPNLTFILKGRKSNIVARDRVEDEMNLVYQELEEKFIQLTDVFPDRAIKIIQTNSIKENTFSMILNHIMGVL